MPRFEAVPGGVRVISDAGVIIGEARAFGQKLSSDDALAQLGYKSDTSGELAVMSGTERTARVRRAVESSDRG